MASWMISLRGFDPYIQEAPTRSAARAASWRAASEAGYFSGKSGFRDFLLRVRVTRADESQTGLNSDKEASE